MKPFLVAALWCIASAGAASAQPKDLKAFQNAAHRVIDDAKPSIASILVSRSERYREFNALSSGPEGKLGGFDSRALIASAANPARRELLRRLDLSRTDSIPESYGSGVVLDASGLILTHFHVVQDAAKIFVRLPDKPGSYADIFAADGRSDLAVLKLINPPADLKPIRFGNGDKVRQGDYVIGVAYPFSAGIRDDAPTSVQGSVSNLVRGVAVKDTFTEMSRTIPQLGVLIETDLRLNSECNGGAVFNLDGELIGLTTSIQGLPDDKGSSGLSLPMTADIKRIIGVLKRGEEVEYGLLGVTINKVETRAFDPTGAGVVIGGASDGLPARRAGLQAYEIITEIDDAPIRDYDDLFLHVGAALAGSDVILTVKGASGRARKVPVKLAKFGYNGPSIAMNRPAPVYGLRVDFSSIANTNSPVAEGVLIRDVESGSAADRKYKDLLERGRWIITTVNGKPVSAPADFYREVAAAKGGALDLKIVEAARYSETPARTLTFP